MSKGARNLPLYYEGEWDTTLPYVPRQVVTVTTGSARAAYMATASNTGQAPPTHPSSWLPLGGPDNTPHPHARAFLHSVFPQSIPSDGADHNLTFYGVMEDNASMWDSGDPNFLTVPRDGLYALHGVVTWPAAAGGGERRAVIYTYGSGAGIVAADVGVRGTGIAWQAPSACVPLVTGDQVGLLVGQTSGSALLVPTGPSSARATLSATYIGAFA